MLLFLGSLAYFLCILHWCAQWLHWSFHYEGLHCYQSWIDLLEKIDYQDVLMFLLYFTAHGLQTYFLTVMQQTLFTIELLCYYALNGIGCFFQQFLFHWDLIRLKSYWERFCSLNQLDYRCFGQPNQCWCLC